jgi:hypothetical protein
MMKWLQTNIISLTCILMLPHLLFERYMLLFEICLLLLEVFLLLGNHILVLEMLLLL